MVMTLMVMTEHGELANGHDVMRVMTINGHDEDTMIYHTNGRICFEIK